MYDVVALSLRDFYKSYKQYISFTVIYMLLTSFLFVPIISYMFNRIVRFVSTGSLLNMELYQIVVSVPGLVGLLLIGFFAVSVLLVEFGVMIIIANQQFHSRKIFVSHALLLIVRKLPKILGLGFFQIIVFSLLLIPFIQLSGIPALLDFNLPIFLTNQWYSSTFAFLMIVVILIVLVIRSIFTLHFLFLEGHPLWSALKESWQLTKKNNVVLIIQLCLITIFFNTLLFAAIQLLSSVSDIIVNDFILTFSSFMTYLVSICFIPINTIVITRLFYSFKENQGNSVVDRVDLPINKRLAKVEYRVLRFFRKGTFRYGTFMLLLLAGMFWANEMIHDKLVYVKWNVQIAAHRGDAYHAPENSLSSIRQALDKGVDAVEIDVMLTRDNVVILHHDLTLSRVAGIPVRVSEMTYDELKEIDIGRLFSDEFIGETIPTLDEVLLEMKQENVSLIIDLKPIDTSGRLAEEVVQLIEKHQVEDAVYVQSFDYDSLQVVRENNNLIKIGQILYASAGNLSNVDVDFYTIRQTMLSERFITHAKALDREVWVWTVNIERNMREVLSYDIDGIITSHPEKLQALIGISFVQE